MIKNQILQVDELQWFIWMVTYMCHEQNEGSTIGVPLAQGSDVTNFLKDVPRVPKSVSK